MSGNFTVPGSKCTANDINFKVVTDFLCFEG